MPEKRELSKGKDIAGVYCAEDPKNWRMSANEIAVTPDVLVNAVGVQAYLTPWMKSLLRSAENGGKVTLSLPDRWRPGHVRHGCR